MSRRALAMAARDALWEEFSMTADNCELAPLLGQPPPNCGEVFFGVWCPSRTNTNRGIAALCEYYALTVTATFRIQGRTPFDRIGTQRWSNVHESILATGIDDAIDKIRACLGVDVKDHSVIRAANEYLEVGSATFPHRGFVEPLHFLGDDMQAVGPRWFNSRGQNAQYGVKVDIRFGQALRIQKYLDDDEEPT